MVSVKNKLIGLQLVSIKLYRARKSKNLTYIIFHKSKKFKKLAYKIDSSKRRKLGFLSFLFLLAFKKLNGVGL